MNIEKVRDFLVSHIQRTRNIREVKGSDRLIGDIGLDSLQYAALVVATEMHVDGELDESGIDWLQVQTVDDLAQVLAQKIIPYA